MENECRTDTGACYKLEEGRMSFYVKDKSLVQTHRSLSSPEFKMQSIF